jgi:fermentation-respiration switch protein FrsA (DUF1100 family)
MGLFTALLLVIAAVAFVLWVTRLRAVDIMRPAHAPITRTAESFGLTNVQDVSFKSQDGLTLKGWYIPPKNGSVIIIIHGHAGNRTNQAPDAALLVKQGYGALLFDLRNSGESEGTLTTFGLQETMDVQGAITFVKAQPGVDANKIGALGQSMGGATAIMSAARYPELKATIAESAYTSMEDNITTGVQKLAGLPPFPFAPLIIFWGEWEANIKMSQVRPIDDIASISPRAILLVHGELDDLIPVENAHQLYAAARDPKALEIIPNAGHQDMVAPGGEAYAQTIISFFDKYLLGK